MNWKQKRFKDFITLQRGFDLPKAKMKEGSIPVLGSNCIIGYHNEAKVEPPGVVTGRSGTLGIVQFIDRSYWPHNTALWVKDYKENHPKYVYYLLKTLNLSNFNGGASVPTLNRNVLDNLPLLVPQYENQRRIAAVLSNYDDLIENNHHRIQLLERAARLIYEEWFVRLRFPGHEKVEIKDGVPKRWGKKLLSELCIDIRDQIDPNKEKSDCPYIGLEHIPRLSITLNNWGNAGSVSSTKYRFQKGDILFGKIRPYFHKVGFAIVDGITSSDAIVIRPQEGTFFEFLLFLVSSSGFVAIASKTVREGSKMPRADWKFLLQNKFIYPSDSILDQFKELISPTLKMLEILALQNKKLAEARDLLLPRLINGEIEV